MNTLNWKEIWGQRNYEALEALDLETLIKLDGFDTGAGRIEAGDWQVYVTEIAQKLHLKNNDSVYELGCGSGAFLFALSQQYLLTVGGLDYSEALINVAIRAMPGADFIANEAKLLETTKQYDFVISNSVFHYFSHQYAAEVIALMLQKAKVAVAIMEIPDINTKQESEMLRRDTLTPEAYEKKYAGLAHTYYKRDWFKQQAILNGCSCEVFDGCVPNYAQNQFRFGVLFKKT